MSLSQKQKSKIIGFRVPPLEYSIWQLYCSTKKRDLTRFIKDSVHSYMEPARVDEGSDSDLPLLDYSTAQALANNNRKSGKKYVNLRINVQELNRWDEFCSRNLINRTHLILEATRKKIQPNTRRPLRDHFHVKRILNNLIREWGLMDFDLISTIFDVVDPAELTNMLNSLESDYFVMRKVHDAYTSTDQEKRSPDIRTFIEYFTQILELWKESESEIDPTDIKRLDGILLEYLTVATQKVDHLSQDTKISFFHTKMKSIITEIDSLLDTYGDKSLKKEI